MRWSVLAWLVLVACNNDHSIGCGKGAPIDPDDFGPQPGFEPVANAPNGIEQVFIDGSGRPVLRTSEGLHRYDGNGAWTIGPSIPTIRTFFGAERELYAVDATGGVYLLVETTFEWMAIGNPPVDDVIGSDFVGRFHGVDRATHSLWTWTPGDPMWTVVPDSALPAAPVEAIVTHAGFVYRTIGDGVLYRTNGATTTSVAASDGTTLDDDPRFLATDRSNNLYFATCANDSVPGWYFEVRSGRMGWTRRRSTFVPYTTCASLQYMPGASLMTFVSDPLEPSVNNTAMFDMPVDSGSATQVILNLDGNYQYVARDTSKAYGFRSDDVAPQFIESTF